ncbi:beta-ketoacyl synthase chain length factor [Desulfomarina sp.]
MIRILKVCSLESAELETPAELAKQLRRADEYIRLAVVGGYNVLRETNEIEGVPNERRGLFLGTAFGTMETNFDVLDQIISGEQTSPILFSHSVFNAAAGYMASIFSLRGCSLTVTDFSLPFFRVLEQGALAIMAGMLDSCLVLQVESYSVLLNDAGRRMIPDFQPWIPGVVCWLLTKSDRKRGWLLEEVSVESGIPGTVDCFLKNSAEIIVNNEKKLECPDPLAPGRILTEEMTSDGTGWLDYLVRAPSVTVRCRIRR